VQLLRGIGKCVDKFLKYHSRILLGEHNVTVDMADISKTDNWNESVQEISNDNGVRVANVAKLEI
jgi:hypothetical protein